MTEKDIRPIPKYIRHKIEQADRKAYLFSQTQTRFYAYLTLRHKELIKVTVAVKLHRKQLYMKAVAWHGVHSKDCFVKDIEYNRFCGMAYRVGWYDEGIQKEKRWYERGICYADDRYYDPWAPVVNPEIVEKLPEYKYSAYRLYQGTRILQYLRLYERYPQLEMLMKAGLGMYYDSVTILKRIGTDKAFCKWLISNKEELTCQYGGYYVETVMQAYRTNRPVGEVQAFLQQKNALNGKPTISPSAGCSAGKSSKSSSAISTSRKSHRGCTLTTSKPASIYSWICPCRKTGFRTTSCAGTISASTNTQQHRQKRARRQNATLKRHSAKLRKSILSYSTISAVRSSASSQRRPPTLCARESFCTIAWGV